MKLPWSKPSNEEAGNEIIGKVLWQNEIQANRLTTISMCACSTVLLLSMLLKALGVFTENAEALYTACGSAIMWHLVPCAICYRYKYAKPWLKHLLLTGLIIGQARVDCGLGFNVMLSILLPVVFSTRYYSRRLTVMVAAITTFVFAVATYLGAVTGFTPRDLNILSEPATYARDVMVTSFFPKWLLFAVISGVCAEIAKRGREMVFEQAMISQEHSRVETELHTATQIQLRSLPETNKVVNGRKSGFELACSMLPAKEVGGDFYDFFQIDPTHLALVIADVSGKGVPAALFMMVSKTLLDTSAATGHTPHEVLTTVNHQLCEKNINDMFVTVWLGILDLTTGKLVSANAGHENPIVCRKDGTVEVIKTKHGMVLGGIDGVRYRDEVTQLNVGDALFVYTDGIPEAHNMASEMYGMERLTNVLKNKQDMPLQAMVDAVQQDVNVFAGEAPQFDDSTMLALRLTNLMSRPGLQLHPDAESIGQVKEYVNHVMEQAQVPARQADAINHGMNEMYDNIVQHSGANWAEVLCSVSDGCVSVVLRDNGVPHDPTKLSSPSAQAGDIHYAGIQRIRDAVDEFSYQYVDGCNESTIKMNL